MKAILLLIAVFSFPLFVQGEEEAVRQESSIATEVAAISVEEQIRSVVERQVKTECPTCRIDLMIHNKKSIDDIAVPDKIYADHWRGQTNLVLRLEDVTRMVTVTVRWFDQVVMAKENIRQGQQLSKENLKIAEKDVTFITHNYANSIQNVIGLEGRRVFKRGQVIDESFLKKPLVVRYGQPIELILDEGALSVTMQAVAKGAGAIGDRIPVYIKKTKTKLSAKIIDQTTARVE